MDFRTDLSWEFLSDDEIEAKAVRAVRNHVRHAKECSPFYRLKFDYCDPDDIISLDDISKLPLTGRNELAKHSSQFVGVEPEAIVETVITTGITDKSLPFVFTGSDLDRIAFSSALSLHTAEVTSRDRVLILLSMDRCSLEGMAIYRGAVVLGANSIRIGAGASNAAVLRKCLQFFKPTVIIAVPSQLHQLTGELNKIGYDTEKNPIAKLICTGESMHTSETTPNALSQALEGLWNAQVFSLYSATELAVHYGECTDHKGLHAHPELVYSEIVDEEGRSLPDGEVGELVATPLGVEGVPLVRYRTGDMTFKIKGDCGCGRHSCRIGPILGRRSQVFTFQGKTIFPLNLTNALDRVDEVKDYLIILENDKDTSDAVTIHVAALPAALEKISQSIKAATGVFIPAIVSNIPTIQSLRGGAKKKITILDQRRKEVPVDA